MTMCYYDIMYVFQSEFKLYSCLNVKELLARNSLNGSNRIRIQAVVGSNHVAVT